MTHTPLSTPSLFSRRLWLRTAVLAMAGTRCAAAEAPHAQAGDGAAAASIKQADPGARGFTLAVVPQFPAVEIHNAWTPLLDRLSSLTGRGFKLMPFASIPEFEAAFLEGRPDFVYFNPYHAVMAHAAQGYLPLVREQKRLLSGLLAVRADSPWHDVAQLNGLEIAFPSPNAFGASLYMRSLLAERGIRITPRYVKTHSNAYRHALTGATAAAGGIRATLEKEEPEVQRSLRVIFETPATAPHPLAAHPRVSASVREAVREAVIGLSRAGGSENTLLQGIQMPHPAAADYARDYQPLEALRLERYVVLEQD